MATTRGAAARLRRTFQYPTEDPNDSDDSQPEAIDEQEQDALIKRLAAENQSRNVTFARTLLVLSLAATVPYLPTLILLRPSSSPGSSSSSDRLIALLSITSLCSTAFLLHRLPASVTGIPLIDDFGKKKTTGGGRPGENIKNATKRELLRLGGGVQGSPLETFLPYLNLGLAVVLVLMGLVTKSEAASFGWIGMGTLPAVVYGVVLLAKLVMASVDPESELSSLKYDYKGA